MPKKPPRRRLDELVFERGLSPSLRESQALIMSGQIRIKGEVSDKPGTQFPENIEISSDKDHGYVGRGALKLRGALDHFGIKVEGRVAADVGSSTGGFTQVLLEDGVSKVYAIDVGYGELAWNLRSDPRVVVMERTNARYVETLPESVNFACMDVSFISAAVILPNIKKWVSSDAEIIILVKPQFEADKEEVGAGGIVTDPKIHEKVIQKIIDAGKEIGFHSKGFVESQIQGAEGNREFFLWFRTNEQ